MDHHTEQKREVDGIGMTRLNDLALISDLESLKRWFQCRPEQSPGPDDRLSLEWRYRLSAHIARLRRDAESPDREKSMEGRKS